MADPSLLERVLREHFSPAHLVVEDDSARHAGHAGAIPGKSTHFIVTVVSEAFEGKSRVERHRMVHDLFGTELRSGSIHALALTLRTPGEWQASQ